MTGTDSQRVSWLMFADDKRPTSMRMVLGMRLAETDPVVILEPPLSVLRTHSIPSLERRASRIAHSEAGWHYHPLHFPEKMQGLSGIVRSLNCRLLQRELSRLAPEGALRIACYDSPGQHHLAGKLGEHLSIYLAVDDRTCTVWGESIEGELEDERHLLGKVDMVICVSEFLAETLKARMPEGRNVPVHVLPNGYNERLFDPSRNWGKPSLLAEASRPNILVAGHVSERIDWDGIIAAARARPEWTWLFVGPADSGMPEKIEALGRMGTSGASLSSPRFLWKAPISVEQMPGLISHCDACAVPYRLNPFTLASNPLKGIEYLAMGAPVLSTRVPALLHYGSAIHWVEQGNGESYARAIDAMGHDRSFEARRAAVSGDSHEARVRQFRRIVLPVAGVPVEPPMIKK